MHHKTAANLSFSWHQANEFWVGRYNKTLLDRSRGKQWVLFPLGPVIKCLLATLKTTWVCIDSVTLNFMAPMPVATFFVSLLMWLLQSSLLSMVTPSDFAVVTWLTWLSLIVVVGESVRVFNLCLELMSINSVLVIFKVRLFALNQLWTLSKSWFKYDRKLSPQSPAYVRWVSLAYIVGSQLDKQFGRSLIYNRNSSGPRIVPCGTPQVSERLLDNDPLTEHICVQFSKYDLNQLYSFPQMPQWLNLDINCSNPKVLSSIQYAFLGHLRVHSRGTLSTHTHIVFHVVRAITTSCNLRSEVHCIQSAICSLQSAVCSLQPTVCSQTPAYLPQKRSFEVKYLF